jgi:hypothetical protein
MTSRGADMRAIFGSWLVIPASGSFPTFFNSLRPCYAGEGPALDIEV